MSERLIPVRSVQELADLPPLADKFDIGQSTEALATRMRVPVESGEEPSTERLMGDILRRTCHKFDELGKEACKAVCLAPEGYDNSKRDCSDLNLAGGLIELGINPREVLMVGVTADNIGFYDELENYENEEGKKLVTQNNLGFREIAGFNAFFARASEEVVLGARLADCGFAAVEMFDAEGEAIRGFVHLTRPNMQGQKELKFEIDGKPAGSFEYYLDAALKHYVADKSTVNVRVVAAIKAENFVHNFKDEAGNRPEDRFPGWFDQWMLENRTDPGWRPGERIDPRDQWYPQYREMVRWQIERTGLIEEQISFEGCIDPGDLEIGHASNHAGAHGKMPDARDAYLIRSKQNKVQ